MSRTFKSTIAAFAIAALFAPAALAQPGVEKVSVRVPYGDLNMSSPAAGHVLLKRIQGAARQACGNQTASSPRTIRMVANCRREAVETAVRDANIGTLNLAWSGNRRPNTFALR